MQIYTTDEEDIRGHKSSKKNFKFQNNTQGLSDRWQQRWLDLLPKGSLKDQGRQQNKFNSNNPRSSCKKKLNTK